MRRAYRVDEVCEALGIGRNKVYHLLAAGTLKSVKLDTMRLVTADSLERLLSGEAAE